MVNWKIVIRPKHFGGLGLQAERMTNISLLGKLVCALEHHKEKLWGQILMPKYLNNALVFTAKDCRNASYFGKVL